MTKNHFSAVILAAGKGTRMKSPLPKVIHPVAGMPMIARVIMAARNAGLDETRVVVGYGKDLILPIVESYGALGFVQEKQLGTADAVKAAQVETIQGPVIILNGDHPLIQSEDIQALIEDFSECGADLCVVTTELDNPGSYGRIVRSQGRLHSIVEARDAGPETKNIKEINTGIYLVKEGLLAKWLPQIKNNNSQGEFYLTDIVILAQKQGAKIDTLKARNHVAFGINDQKELSEVTRRVFQRKIEKLMESGVIVIDSTSAYVEDSAEIGPGSVLYPNVFVRGKTKIGSFCVLEPNVFISDSTIQDSVQIRMGSHLEKAVVASKCLIGPYARLRPGSDVGEEAHIGNFVELKNVQFGKGSKANHLTYLGDAEIGEDTNIGCGTITCNYAVDKKKYKTTIGSHCFVGSDTQFVAPVTIGDRAVIGSGSTITKDVPAQALAVARGKQVIKENYITKTGASSGAESKSSTPHLSGSSREDQREGQREVRRDGHRKAKEDN